ncbi:efflux RND transporter periplasmic adaptor subunit, partial [bacterium]|nr:efflux RND transporter periplasmic adaptor subunit [bacterium]
KKVTSVVLGLAKQGSLTQETSLTGHLESVDKANVVSRVAGRVQDVLVRAGDKVSKGQLLVQLDNSTQTTKVNAAKAALAQANAGLVQAQANYHAAQTKVEQAKESEGIIDVSSSLEVQRARQGVTQAEASLASAQANYDDALYNMRRQQDLFAKGAVSSYNREQAELRERTSFEQLKAAKSGLATAKEGLRIAENAQRQVSISKGDVKNSLAALEQAAAAVEQAKASVVSAQASLEAAVIDLEDMAVKSPITGTVTVRNVEPGQSLGANGATLFTIVDNSKLEMISSVDEQFRPYIKPGTKLELKTNIVSDKVPAKVIDVIPASDPASHTIKVRLSIPNTTGMLVEGAYVESPIPIKEISGVIVPREAVTVSTTGTFVMAFEGGESEGTAKRYPVELLYSTAEESVVKGITPGLKVVTSGAIDLVDGESLKVEENGKD